MTKSLIRDPLTWSLALFSLFILFIVGSCSMGIYGANKAADEFETVCTKAGGVVIRLRRDSLCVSPDGRILGDL